MVKVEGGGQENYYKSRRTVHMEVGGTWSGNFVVPVSGRQYGDMDKEGK